MMGGFEEISHLVFSPLPFSPCPSPGLTPRIGVENKRECSRRVHPFFRLLRNLVTSSLPLSLFLFLLFLIHSFIPIQGMKVVGSALASRFNLVQASIRASLNDSSSKNQRIRGGLPERRQRRKGKNQTKIKLVFALRKTINNDAV